MRDEKSIMNVKIANIKFALYRKKPKAYHSRLVTEYTESEHRQMYEERRTSAASPSPPLLNHSSLIPHTNIRTSLRKVSQTSKIASTSSFDYPNASYSMFPFRKPKSVRSTRCYLPVSRQKIKLHYSGHPEKGKVFDFRVKRGGVNSCLDLKEQQEGNFVRYSLNGLQTQFIQRRQKTDSDKEKEFSRIYF